MKYLENVWFVNLIGAIKEGKSIINNTISFGNYKYQGYTEVSFKIIKNGIVRSGICGYIKDANNNLVFTFAGNIPATSPLNVEFQALSILTV